MWMWMLDCVANVKVDVFGIIIVFCYIVYVTGLWPRKERY